MFLEQLQPRKILQSFKNRSFPEGHRVSARNYPEKVTYALNYRDFQLGPEELLSLSENGFVDYSFMLTTKALGTNPTDQLEFLEDVTLAMQAGTEGNTQGSIRQHVQQLDRDIRVPGTELRRFNIEGFDLWEDLSRKTAADCFREGKTPVFIAHAALLSYRDFIEQYRSVDTSLFMLMPKWLEDAENQQAGYEIVPNSETIVRPLYKDFQRPANIKIIDDVRTTGASLKKIATFWHQEEGFFKEAEIGIIKENHPLSLLQEKETVLFTA